MIQIQPGDLLRIAANGRFYYALTLDRISMFGGQLCFVLHRVSERPLEADEILARPLVGFCEIVDFIWAKREKRIERIAKKVKVDALNRSVTCFKSTFTTKGKAEEWKILSREGEELRRVQKLTTEEKRLPLYERIDDSLMVELVDRQWLPEKDERI